MILWALRQHLAFPISGRDLASTLAERGVEVEHTPLFRWVQAHAPALEQRVQQHLRPCSGPWRVDEACIKVKGAWTYRHRAVGRLGQAIDLLLSAKRDAAAARRFFRKALKQPHAVNPRTITVDQNPASPRAVRDLKRTGRLRRGSRLRHRMSTSLSNVVEQDHRRITGLVRPGLGFGGLRTARRSWDMKAPAAFQAAFVAGLFGMAA